MLTFDQDKHEYRWQGRIVPSVTQILKPLRDFSGIPAEVLIRKRDIGVALHAAVALDIGDDLDEDTVDEAVRPYLIAWREFRRENNLHQADFGEVEQPMVHALHRYAGTPDLTVFLNRRWSLIDLKTETAIHPATAVQTAAYLEMVNSRSGSKVLDRFGLQLRADGSYRLEQYKDKQDFNIFISLLNVHRWKESHA